MSEDENEGSFTYKFEEKQNVIVHFKAGHHYEAKIVKRANGRYLVHYNKWNSKWDEWKEESEVFEDTKENREEKCPLGKNSKKQAAEKEKKEKLAQKLKQQEEKKESKKSEENANKRRRLKKEEGEEGPEVVGSVNSKNGGQLVLTLKFSGELKRLLVVDSENIQRKQMLVPLPRDPTARTILEEYAEERAKLKKDDEKMSHEVMMGVKHYFNRALPKLLLYPFERPQYERITEENKDKQPIDIYGAEHLLRLFVKFPELLSQTKLEEDEAKSLHTYLADLLKWLEKKKSYFTSDYEKASAKYLQEIPDFLQNAQKASASSS